MPSGRILAVDDQPYFRSFIQELLREDGYEVRTAASAAEAYHALEHDDFDAVLTDVVLPDVEGIEFVRALRDQHPEVTTVVLASVGDVKTAVDCMKEGAGDYLLKPIERGALQHTLESLFARRRLEAEHHRLMQENLDYMGELSLYERAMGLFSTLSLEPLAERIVDGLCLETGAQGAVLWIAPVEESPSLRLVAAKGLVRMVDEPEEIQIRRFPREFDGMADGFGTSRVIDVEHELAGRSVPAGGLYVPFVRGGELIALARLTDKLERQAFEDGDRAAVEKFVELAGLGLANALRFRSLERRSFKDPTTKAYTLAYFEDLVRNEIHKASRFGRHFSLLKIDLGNLDPIRRQLSDPELGHWLESVVFHVARALRSTDLVAAESDSRYRVLLPETDALGAAVLKRRIREMWEREQALRPEGCDVRPDVTLAAATFPADGDQLESIVRVLDGRLEEARGSVVRELEGEKGSFALMAESLLRVGGPGRAETADQATRFLLDEVARRPGDRGLLFLAPGGSLSTPVRDGLERLRGLDPATRVVMLCERGVDPPPGVPVQSAAAGETGFEHPFVIYYGEGPAYALLGSGGSAGGSLYHTGDRALVEHLAFELQRDLDVALSA
ncbi:MAG: response regulator [Deltaproteobacteria bacterium]|nr:response regulator [Deltaproteobacteria bacterium]